MSEAEATFRDDGDEVLLVSDSVDLPRPASVDLVRKFGISHLRET